MSKELKETMIKAVKECMMTMSHRIENFNKETDTKKKKKGERKERENQM